LGDAQGKEGIAILSFFGIINLMIKKRIAFTLIELLVVIAIIGILSGLIVVAMGGITTNANIAKAKVFSNSLRNALMMSLVSEWKLDEGSGTATADTWSGGNSGTLLDSGGACSATLCPQWQTTNCVYKDCLSFNGTGAYIEVSGSNVSTSNLAMTGAITLSAWVKFNAAGTMQSIMGRGLGSTGSGNYGYFLVRNITTNKLFFNVDSATTRNYIDSSSAISDANWHYLAATWDGTTNANGLKLYIDGKLDNQAASSSSAMGQPNYNFRIGDDGGGNYPLNGFIDEARIFNATIPISQIKEQYYAGLGKLLSAGGIDAKEYQKRLAELNTFSAYSK